MHITFYIYIYTHFLLSFISKDARILFVKWVNLENYQKLSDIFFRFFGHASRYRENNFMIINCTERKEIKFHQVVFVWCNLRDCNLRVCNASTHVYVYFIKLKQCSHTRLSTMTLTFIVSVCPPSYNMNKNRREDSRNLWKKKRIRLYRESSYSLAESMRRHVKECSHLNNVTRFRSTRFTFAYKMSWKLHTFSLRQVLETMTLFQYWNINFTLFHHIRLRIKSGFSKLKIWET